MADRTPGRVTTVVVLIVVATALGIAHRVLSIAFYPVEFYSGWALFGAVLLLALFGFRKKVSFLPVGSATTWLRVHIVVGLLSGFVFWLHTHGRIPTGIPDTLVAVSFGVTFLSGIVGLVLSRSIPQLLAGRGAEVIFERIPSHISQLRNEVESLILNGKADSSDNAVEPCPVLVDLYARELQPFFAAPRNTLSHLLQLAAPRTNLLNEIESQRRFLSGDEQTVLDEIVQITTTKDDLDYHYAHQGLLKLWLFVHIPATFSLLIFALLHLALVYSFVG